MTKTELSWQHPRASNQGAQDIRKETVFDCAGFNLTRRRWELRSRILPNSKLTQGIRSALVSGRSESVLLIYWGLDGDSAPVSTDWTFPKLVRRLLSNPEHKGSISSKQLNIKPSVAPVRNGHGRFAFQLQVASRVALSAPGLPLPVSQNYPRILSKRESLA